MANISQCLYMVFLKDSFHSREPSTNVKCVEQRTPLMQAHRTTAQTVQISKSPGNRTSILLQTAVPYGLSIKASEHPLNLSKPSSTCRSPPPTSCSSSPAPFPPLAIS